MNYDITSAAERIANQVDRDDYLDYDNLTDYQLELLAGLVEMIYEQSTAPGVDRVSMRLPDRRDPDGTSFLLDIEQIARGLGMDEGHVSVAEVTCYDLAYDIMTKGTFMEGHSMLQDDMCYEAKMLRKLAGDSVKHLPVSAWMAAKRTPELEQQGLIENADVRQEGGKFVVYVADGRKIELQPYNNCPTDAARMVNGKLGVGLLIGGQAKWLGEDWVDIIMVDSLGVDEDDPRYAGLIAKGMSREAW